MNAQEARIQTENIRNGACFAAKTKVYSNIKSAVANGKFSIVEYDIPHEYVDRLVAILKADGYTTKYLEGDQRGGNSLTISW